MSREKMTHFLKGFLLSAASKQTVSISQKCVPKDVFDALLKTGRIRTLKTLRLPGKALTNRKPNSSVMGNNVRFTSEKASDRFIPKDPLEKKNLWKPVLITITLGGLFTAYMLHLKEEKMKRQEKERTRALGKSAIGGKFELVDQNNKTRKSDDFLGNWLLIYFGFTHCPDICPDEMEKMVQVVDLIDEDETMPNILPIFITVDPERDTPSIIGKYVKEFSDKFIALTGTIEQIAAACKAYRVYFSAGPKDKDSDYIVDHTVIMYLVNPEGEFIDYYGQNSNAQRIANSIKFNIVKYKSVHDKEGFFSKFF